jgi:hypothetical protein
LHGACHHLATAQARPGGANNVRQMQNLPFLAQFLPRQCPMSRLCRPNLRAVSEGGKRANVRQGSAGWTQNLDAIGSGVGESGRILAALE